MHLADTSIQVVFYPVTGWSLWESNLSDGPDIFIKVRLERTFLCQIPMFELGISANIFINPLPCFLSCSMPRASVAV